VRIIVAPDKFKGCLTAPQVCDAIAAGIGSARPDATIDLCPVADGGEGTVAALVSATRGRFETRRVTGPLPEMKVDATFGVLGDGATAVVEMSAACGLALLQPEDRNPDATTTFGAGQLLVEAAKLGVTEILWLGDGIEGDDTDGHIDDTVRFVNEDTVLAVVEENVNDVNHELLRTNLNQLNAMRLLNGKQLNIVELPMPDEVVYEDQRLPASYANFYIANKSVIVPTFRCNKDDKALTIIQNCFPSRKVIGIDSTELIWGLGSFHCLSQQEPAVDGDGNL